MTQEEFCTRLDHELHLSSGNVSDEEGVIIRKERASVKDMILRFEKTNIHNHSDSRESLSKYRDPNLGSLTSVVNPIQSHYQHLYPVSKSQDRNSNVSVNSILSNASEHSFESSSSGFISDRKSGIDLLVPHRPAPPPPLEFRDSYSPEVTSPIPEETVTFRERRFSLATPSTSPVVTRRLRQPPVMRKKSTAGSQVHTGERHWSYGVTQKDIEKLLRLKRSDPSDTEEEIPAQQSSADSSETESSEDSRSNSDNVSEGKEYFINEDDNAVETLSNDHSTDTLINEEDSDVQSDKGDNESVSSDEFGDRANYDNVSIKSISSFDGVPYQKYDSITVSSDEFGSEVCHAPDAEFLTVSAVNEWCISKSTEPVLLPIESKKEKYRR